MSVFKHAVQYLRLKGATYWTHLADDTNVLKSESIVFCEFTHSSDTTQEVFLELCLCVCVCAIIVNKIEFHKMVNTMSTFLTTIPMFNMLNEILELYI